MLVVLAFGCIILNCTTKKSACCLRHGQRFSLHQHIQVQKKKQKKEQEQIKSRVVKLKLRCRSPSSNRSWNLRIIMAIAGPTASNQTFSGGRRQTTCLFFFLIGGLLTSCTFLCLLFSSFFHSQRFHSIAKQTSCSVSCLFSEPTCFWCIPSSFWLSVDHETKQVNYIWNNQS